MRNQAQSMSLFSKDQIKPSLHILHHTLGVYLNGKSVQMPISKIFDYHKYDTLACVTYSASGPFINKYVSKFQNGAKIIIGIPEKRVAENVSSAISRNISHQMRYIMTDRLPKFFNSLSTLAQKMYRQSKISLYSPLEGSIHSKFYLLSNSVTGESRAIIGSANLSTQAFSDRTPQFEDVALFDHNDGDPDSDRSKQLFDSLRQRFNQELLPICIPLSYKLLQASLPGSSPANNKKKQSDKQTDPKVIAPKQYAKCEDEQVKDLKKRVEYLPLPVPVKTGVYDDLRHSGDDLNHSNEQRKRNKVIDKTIYHLKKDYVSPRSKRPKAASDRTADKKIRYHIKGLHEVKYHQVKNATAHREGQLLDYPTKRTIDNTGLMVSDESGALHSFGKLASKDEIKAAIDNYVDLEHNYQKYVPSFTPHYFQRVLEAFIYAYTAPFMSDIERHLPQTERRKVHEYLFIGGKKGSGKSNLISLMKRSLGLYDNKRLVSYDNLVDDQSHNGKSETIKYIERCLSNTPNVAPFFLDELEPEFFEDKYGGNMVKNYDNAHDNFYLKPFPVFIGTTNEGSYNMSDAAKSRSYYINNSREFDTSNGDSAHAYNRLEKRFNDTLFKDFIVRFSKLFLDENVDWEHYDSRYHSILDYLYQSRRIFARYFRIAGFKKLPDWFPKHPCDDSERKGKEQWRKWYQYHSDQFQTSSDDPSKMQFDIHNIVGNGNARTSFYAAKRWKDYLPSEIMPGDETNDRIITLIKSAFFKWIQIDPQKFADEKARKQAKQTFIKDQRDKKQQKLLKRQHRHHIFKDWF